MAGEGVSADGRCLPWAQDMPLHPTNLLCRILRALGLERKLCGVGVGEAYRAVAGSHA